MKISRAIMELKAIQANKGDIEICLNTDQAYRDLDGSFIPLFVFSTEEVHQENQANEMVKTNIAVLEFHPKYVTSHE